MKKILIILSMCIFSSDAIASPPVYGPLQAQNNLDDVDSASTSLSNLGGAPISSPTFIGTVTVPSGSILNTPASINLTNATAIPYSALPALSSNQLLGSLTSTTPSGQSVPSCSASNDALLWTSGVGFNCNSSINASTLGGATFASPGSIGGTTPAAGKFTTLQATSTVTGIGLIGVQVFFSGTSTYTPDAGTQSVIVEVQAPGGGTGGCAATGAGNACTSGGSGAGSYGRVYITSGFSGVTVTIGTGGAAGTAGNNAGGTEGTTSFGTIISCPGGVGSPGGAADTPSSYIISGTGGGYAPACTFGGGQVLTAASGLGGNIGTQWNSTSLNQLSGAGASSQLGVGGVPVFTNTATSGNTGTGYGSGASG